MSRNLTKKLQLWTNNYESAHLQTLYGKRDNVTFADTPRPVPKADEILVQVHAAGLNPIDYMIAQGTFKSIL